MPMMEVTSGEEMIIQGLRLLLEKSNEAQLKKIGDVYFAKSKQTLFTTSELAQKWGCSKKHVGEVLKAGRIVAVGKRGPENEYNIEEAQQAKNEHDAKVIYNRRIAEKIKAM